MSYLPYSEPSITTILSLTSFILLLNISRYILDNLLYCGIIAEILIGIIYGLPVGGTSWLSLATQQTIQCYGYLGLIGLVFEGGLSTKLDLLRRNAGMSISVATVGLLAPIALSFLLLVFPFPGTIGEGTVYPTPLAAFSAGASLCSTSLGTTFAILSSAGLQRSKIGTVLVGAAMMDDVVGLVMVNIVTTLGAGGDGGWPIARPIAASFGLLLVTLGIASYVLKPCWLLLSKHLSSREGGEVESKSKMHGSAIRVVSSIPHLGFLIFTLVLIIFVTIASFIDASVLFAAFIAGGLVSYLWNAEHRQRAGDDEEFNAPMHMYEQYYKSPMEYILVPFFFASIGFSIPITDMFSAQIAWKGIVYSILMIIAKGVVSLVIYTGHYLKVWQDNRKARSSSAQITHESTKPPHTDALLVGFAMIARGEIGFLIASLSQSSGTLQFKGSDTEGGEPIFLVIVWAVVLCTVVGPVAVGVIVRMKARVAVDA